ncbi:MAG: hypothetical protein AB7M05_11030 [Alphaproteobacteria bacterium]
MTDRGGAPAPEGLAKLPVGPAVIQSFDLVWMNRRSLAPWLAAAVALYAVSSAIFFYGGTADFTDVPLVVRYVLLGTGIFGFIAVAGCLLVAIIIAHRCVLLADEKLLKHGRPSWRVIVRYGGHAILIMLLPSLCAAFAAVFWFSLVGNVVAGHPVFSGVALIIYFLAVVWAAIWIVAHLCLVLPAKASDVPGFGLGNAWRAAKGNALRMAVGGFLVSLPFMPWFFEITRKVQGVQTVRTEYVFRGVLGEPLARLGMPDLSLSILSFSIDAVAIVCVAAFLSHAFQVLRHNNLPELANPEAE